jgi:dephospho-CoA kinase
MAYNKIAVVGRIRSGKNTFADYITENYGHTQMAFSEGIKEVITRYFPEAIISGKPRKHYQLIGQSFRELNPDIWIETLDSKLDRLLSFNNHLPVIITDLRQANEYQYLKLQGFTVVKVQASEETRIKRIAEAGDVFSREQLNHSTELQAEACPYDYLVNNDGTLEELYEQAEFIINELLEERGVEDGGNIL